MKTLCMNFMKEDYLDRLADINVTHPDYLVSAIALLREFPLVASLLILPHLFQMPEDAVELGPGCVEALEKITPHPDTPATRQSLSRDIKVFKKHCLYFYTTAAKEIQSRLPLKDEILRQASFLDPGVLLKPRSEPGALKDINGIIMHYKVQMR